MSSVAEQVCEFLGWFGLLCKLHFFLSVYYCVEVLYILKCLIITLKLFIFVLLNLAFCIWVYFCFCYDSVLCSLGLLWTLDPCALPSSAGIVEVCHCTKLLYVLDGVLLVSKCLQLLEFSYCIHSVINVCLSHTLYLVYFYTNFTLDYYIDFFSWPLLICVCLQI